MNPFLIIFVQTDHCILIGCNNSCNQVGWDHFSLFNYRRVEFFFETAEHGEKFHSKYFNTVVCETLAVFSMPQIR